MDAPQTIKLNVGGMLLETTLTTLTSVKNSVLATMFSSSWHKDNGQVRFINTNPTIFTMILQGLRCGGVDDVCRPTNMSQELWERELNFWGLPKPIVIAPNPDPREEVINKFMQSVGKPGGLAVLDKYSKIPLSTLPNVNHPILDNNGRVPIDQLPKPISRLVRFIDSAGGPYGPLVLDAMGDVCHARP
jgi:hypothetical protein